MNDLIKHKLELLPNNPGCYLHKDKFGNIIYVGKAKNLKNRVRSYFRGSHDTKTELLVSEIADFEFIVTESNIEALLLEINLIQENMPKFNIRLKDDKSYPFIKITKELYPRLLIRLRKMVVSTLAPTQMLVQPMKSRNFWIVFSPLRNVKILPIRSVSITILDNVMPTPSVTLPGIIGKVWLRMSRIS